MKEKRYPIGLFLAGLMINFFFRFFWLFIPSVILMLVGIFFSPCLYIGIAILLIDAIVSLISQLRLRKAFLKESDSPDFRKFQESISRDGNWIANVKNFVGEKIEEKESDK